MSNSISVARTKNYISQVKASISFKAIGISASFLSIPMMIQYLGQEQFGIWSTLLTIISWIVFFDLGISNGLRNKVAESLAKNLNIEARGYISSGFTLIGLIALFLGALLIFGSYYIKWQSVFNTQLLSEVILRQLVQITTFFIVLNFWLGLIISILTALQNTAQIAFGQMLSNLIALSLILILKETTESSILLLAFFYGISLITSNLILGYFLFKKHPELFPQKKIERQHINPLLTIGFQFFIIQLAVLIIFTTDKIMITHFFGPEYVTEYDVVFRFFSIINIGYSLITAPLSSAYTDAFFRNDLTWIKKMLRKQIFIFIAIIIIIFFMIYVGKIAILYWVGPQVKVSFGLIITMGIYTIISVWNNIFGQILSGLSKIRLGSIYTVFTGLINIPISYLFAVKLNYGVTGIMLGTITSIILSSIISPIQVWYFIYSNKRIATLDKILR